MNVSNLAFPSPRRLEFDVANVDPALVNSLRRIILSDIPNVAVGFLPHGQTEDNDVKILVNRTTLHNEFLGHRISLIPICLSDAEIEAFDPEHYLFVLKVENTSNETVPVTTKDLTIYNELGKEYDLKTHRRIFPADPITKAHILIAKLKPHTSLHIEFRARKSTARVHARWSPVSCCTFYNLVDADRLKEARAAQAVQLDDLSEKERRIQKNVFETLEQQRLYQRNEHGEASAFRFIVESECAMTPSTILLSAANILQAKLDRLRDGIDDRSVVQFASLGDPTKLFSAVTVMEEDHTLGNLLQSVMVNTFIRGENSKSLSYVGYHQPHPLEHQIVFKMKLTNNEKTARNLIHEAVQETQSLVEQWKESFQRALRNASAKK